MFHLTRSSFWRGHLFYAFLPFLCLNVPVISFSSLTFRCFLCFCGNSRKKAPLTAHPNGAILSLAIQYRQTKRAGKSRTACRRSNTLRRKGLCADVTLEKPVPRVPKVQGAQALISQAKGQRKKTALPRCLRAQLACFSPDDRTADFSAVRFLSAKRKGENSSCKPWKASSTPSYPRLTAGSATCSCSCSSPLDCGTRSRPASCRSAASAKACAARSAS